MTSTSLVRFGLEKEFSHRVVAAGGTSLHVVEGGSGSVLVLLPGWPQYWIAWRKVMPELVKRHRVVVIDPPGLGESQSPSHGYDTKAIAQDLKGALDALNIRRCQLIGHDVGAWLGYAIASQFPDMVERLVLIDAAVPGLLPDEAFRLSPATLDKTWHFSFNFIPSLSETLIIGREREFLSWLFKNKSRDRTRAFDAEAVEEYVKSYSAPGRWTSGLGYYRAIFDSIAQNRESLNRPLPMPVLAIGAETGTGPMMEIQLRHAAADLQCVVISDCGHYVPEEQPLALLEALGSFLSN